MNKKSPNKYLNNARIYLAGPIDYAKDDGIGWRRHFTEECERLNINANLLDPTDKPGNLESETKDEKLYIAKLKKEGKWDELTAFVKRFVRVDLTLVDKSDILIAYIDTDIFACGTIHEIVVAAGEHKPVLVVVKHGKENCPSWLFGIVKHHEIFSSMNECISHLNKINKEGTLDERYTILEQYL